LEPTEQDELPEEITSYTSEIGNQIIICKHIMQQDHEFKGGAEEATTAKLDGYTNYSEVDWL
jgi:hypothetical protein